MAEAVGALSVALRRVAWQAAAAADSSDRLAPPPPLWAIVQLPRLERCWFPPDDANARAFPLTPGSGDVAYQQSSRALPLTRETLEALATAQLRISVFGGEGNSGDALLGELQLPLVGAMLGEKLEQRVTIPLLNTVEAADDAALAAAAVCQRLLRVDVCVQADANLADLATGCRVLRFCGLAVLELPNEWTLASESDADALRLCAAPEKNLALYELEIQLPGVASADHSATDVITVPGGKLQYEPSSELRATTAAAFADEENKGETALQPGLTGSWRIAFPETRELTRVIMKDAVDRLKDFISVEKHVGITLRRTFAESTAKVPEVSTVTARMHLSDLLRPGATAMLATARLEKLVPVARESLEQELASTSSNDEKKKFQAALADYESIVQQAASVSSALVTAGTHVEATIEILSAPLVLQPPAALVLPAVAIEELIPQRDLVEERERHEDPITDLQSEIRRVVLTLLQEYEDSFHSPATATDAPPASLSSASKDRDDKKQKLIFRLNTQGVYHSFKESLKKRIIPVIRDRFARSEFAGGDDDNDDSRADGEDVTATAEKQRSRTDEKKAEYFGHLYTLVMQEVHAVLHEAVYSDLDALEKTRARMLDKPTPKEVAATLDALELKALESQVVGDAEKSEAMHLDRIAFAEEHALEQQQQQQQQQRLGQNRHESRHRPSRHALESVWYAYARFSLARGDLEKAGASLRQSLSLNARALPVLLANTALLCELDDFAHAEDFAKTAVAEALAALAGSPSSGSAAVMSPRPDEHEAAAAAAWTHVVLAHALLALYFVRSARDATGNLALFELLKAQQVLQRDGGEQRASACLSSVWLFLVEYAHELKLRGVTQAALQLADSSRKPRDVLSAHERVMKRSIEAELALLSGDAEHATKLLRAALEIDAAHPFAWLVLGRAYLATENQSETAAECLQRALETRAQLRTDELRLGLFVHLGLVLLQASQFASAETVFLQACDEFRVASTWLGVGIACLRLEKWEAAHAALAEANRLDAANPDVWGYLALYALSSSVRVTPQDEADAKRCVAQALRYHLSNPALLRELSNGFVAIDRLEDAEKLLRRSLACLESSLTRKTLADVLAAQNCAEDALRQYRHSLDASEDVLERCALLEECAKLLTTLGRPEEAVEYRGMASAFLLEQQEQQQAYERAAPQQEQEPAD